MDIALQAVYKGTGKGKWGFGKGQKIGMRRVAKAVKMEERTPGRKAAARKEAKGKRKVVRNQNVFDVRQDRTHCSLVQERRKQKICTP